MGFCHGCAAEFSAVQVLPQSVLEQLFERPKPGVAKAPGKVHDGGRRYPTFHRQFLDTVVPHGPMVFQQITCDPLLLGAQRRQVLPNAGEQFEG